MIAKQGSIVGFCPIALNWTFHQTKSDIPIETSKTFFAA
jgi:hypothetical protein